MWAGWGAQERDLNCDLLVFSEKGSLVGGTNIWKHPEDLVWLGLLGSLHHGPSTTILHRFFHQLPDIELLNLEGWCTRSELEMGSEVGLPLTVARFFDYSHLKLAFESQMNEPRIRKCKERESSIPAKTPMYAFSILSPTWLASVQNSTIRAAFL